MKSRFALMMFMTINLFSATMGDSSSAFAHESKSFQTAADSMKTSHMALMNELNKNIQKIVEQSNAIQFDLQMEKSLPADAALVTATL